MIPIKHSFRLVSKKKLKRINFLKTIKKRQDLSKEEAERQEKELELELEKDSSKRAFLKLAGVVGLGALAATFIPKKAEALVFGSTPAASHVGVKDSANSPIDPATEGTLQNVNTNASAIKVATEALKLNSDKFKFDGDNLKTVIGGAVDLALKDALDVRINPAQDENIVLLRRMVKIMESQATVDSANRQRITLDSLGTGTAVTTTLPVSGTVTVGTITSVTNIAAIAGQNQQMYQDVARNTYANGIRNNLFFS